jgi:hypothetical protein
MKLQEFKEKYQDTPEFQQETDALFIELVNNEHVLKELRDFVEQNAFGFGERSFYHLHRMMVESIEDKELTFLEIGVFRGQCTSLYGLFRELCNKNIRIIGVTPLDSSDGHWESDYALDIQIISDLFGLPYPEIIKGSSLEQETIYRCKDLILNILYIDGFHSFDAVVSDINNYSPLVKVGGYMIIDDSANNMKCCYNGRFWGIQSVSDGVDSLLPPVTENENWEYIGGIIHNRIWRRIK